MDDLDPILDVLDVVPQKPEMFAFRSSSDWAVPCLEEESSNNIGQ